MIMMKDFNKERATRAKEILKERGADALLLFPGADIGYFTGFSIGPSERIAAALIPFDDEPVLIVNELEKELRGQESWITELEVWREHQDPVELLASLLKQFQLDRAVIGIAEDAPWGWVNKLKSRVSDCHFVDATMYLSEMRMVKSKEELDYMKMACEVTDSSLESSFEHLQTGMTEKELSSLLGNEIRSRGGENPFNIVLFGERAALPHGRPADRKLRDGDVVLVDTGSIIHGYHSDLTRTVIFGKPSERQKKIYLVVHEANQTAFDAVGPDVECGSLDGIARKVVKDAGFGEYFIHRLGHGIGLQGHEPPYIVRNNELKLKPGMTFTIEPGIYIVGEIGIRIEDTVVCTKEGCERLTELDRNLTSYPIRENI
jgi:Xaa-Pro dipeptidase